jgi:hypothetical protein
MNKTDVAFWLGLYASAVASATGLWSLFRELWMERARLDVIPEDAWMVPVKRQGPMLVKSQEALDVLEADFGREFSKTPILVITIRNRGRREAVVDTASQLQGAKAVIFADLFPQLPLTIPAEQTRAIVIGLKGGHTHGDTPLKHFYVVDGAGRVHPWRSKIGPPSPEPRELPEL